MNRGNPGDSWGKLNDKEREKVLSALKTKFPGRYEELIKQYHKDVQEDSGE